MDIKKVERLSVIIPCYNEAETLGLIVDEVLSADIGQTKKEVIIIDDSSNDGSRDVIAKLQKRHPEIKAIFQTTNQGKGTSLKRGFMESTGDVVIVQDADREYDPRDYNRMLEIFREDRTDIVFGSRFSGGAPRRVVYLANTIANRFMTRLSALLSGLFVSDIHTCYIMFDGDWIRAKAPGLKAKKFAFNPEIVAKIAREKDTLRICETGISYYGRTKAEGKKIGAKDAIPAVGAIIYFNLLARKK